MVRFFSLLKLEQTACMRVAAIKLTKGAWPDEIVVDETTGLAYNDTTYKHRVSECRDLAAARVAAFGSHGTIGNDPIATFFLFPISRAWSLTKCSGST